MDLSQIKAELEEVKAKMKQVEGEIAQTKAQVDQVTAEYSNQQDVQLKAYAAEVINTLQKQILQLETMLVPLHQKDALLTRASLGPMEVDKEDRVQKVINDWEDKVFQVDGENGMQGSGVLIDGKRILTAAHLSFKLHKSYKIRGTNGLVRNAQCTFISKKWDFATLQANDLPDVSTPATNLTRGNNFLVLGYPRGVEASKPTLSKGVIEGLHNDNIHLVGVPGSKRGYSGAPVFDYSGYLAGIVIGSPDSVTFETSLKERSALLVEQAYTLIMGVCLIVGQLTHGISDAES